MIRASRSTCPICCPVYAYWKGIAVAFRWPASNSIKAMRRNPYRWPLLAAVGAMLACLTGCGTVKSRSATEQLILSDAVDRSVSQIDFRPLSDKKVFLDTQFVDSIKGSGFVNADYIISSLRQQMTASRCMLQDEREEADYVVEVRVGTLGSNDHEVNYGIPTSNSVTAASSLLPSVPAVPTIPEISLAKRNELQAAAKIAVFAYDRATREAVWQSGLSMGESTAKATWLLGAGPFESGSVLDRPEFVGVPIRVPTLHESDQDSPFLTNSYYQTLDFRRDEIARLPPGSPEDHAAR